MCFFYQFETDEHVGNRFSWSNGREMGPITSLITLLVYNRFTKISRNRLTAFIPSFLTYRAKTLARSAPRCVTSSLRIERSVISVD